MPAKTKKSHDKKHHKGKHDEKHTKRFLKAYAPYLPLFLIVTFGLFISIAGPLKSNGDVLSYAINTTDPGLLEATNQERIKQGLSPLNYSTSLDSAAQAKAEDMAKRDYWSHNTPDGKEPWVFFDSVDYKYYKAAENLAYGFADSNSTVVGWMNSPGHRANVLDSDLTEVGFGIVNVENYQNKGAETIVVAMYGRPASSPIAGTPEIKLTGNSNAVFATSNTLPEAKKISYAQMLTGGQAPWITFAVGLIIGLSIMYLFLKHTRNIVKAFKDGEKFILHHPLLDTTIVALIALATVVAQTAGVVH
jgi:hypothetical protein